MSYEDNMMEEFCGFENTEEDIEALEDEKIRVAEEQTDQGLGNGGLGLNKEDDI